MKKTFGSDTFMPATFGCSTWTGVFAEVPTDPGLEFELPENRMHFELPENRMEFELPENRMHFAMLEED
jgi:hypothetical protein